MIHTLVDSTSGHELISFLDAYSRYNQILMHQDKTSFVTEQNLLLQGDAFRLKNVGATNHLLVNKIFKNKLEKP